MSIDPVILLRPSSPECSLKVPAFHINVGYRSGRVVQEAVVEHQIEGGLHVGKLSILVAL